MEFSRENVEDAANALSVQVVVVTGVDVAAGEYLRSRVNADIWGAIELSERGGKPLGLRVLVKNAPSA